MAASSSVPPPPAPPASEPPLAKGASLGRYVVIEPLGQGAMGIVYRAFDPELDRRIAVKLLRRSPTSAAREQERLLREGKAMARLAHPNVVAVYDVGTYEERVFVAMELVDGQTLRSWLKEPRTWREIVAMFVQAGRGLAAAHAAGIVHRDFKPDNALVGADGRVRVLDFGLAWTPDGSDQLPEPSYRGPFASSVGVDLSGSLVGTPRYSPPEQIEGRRVDASADQFAFCVSLWEALYGEPPYAGDDLLTLLANAREGRVSGRPPPGLPRRAIEALRRGLAAEPAARFPSMGPLLDALEDDPGHTRRRRLWIASALAIATAGVALAVGARVHDQRLVCQGGERELTGVWDAGRRGAMTQALMASGKPWAGETADHLAAQIDRYASDWVAMRREACEATSLRHVQSEVLLDLRMGCLADRAHELRSLTALLSQPNDELLRSAPKAVYALTPLAGCADAHELTAPVPPPGDPAAREQVTQVRLALADAKAMKELGRYEEAEVVARDLLPRARSLGYAPLEAEVGEMEADALEDIGKFTESVATYHDALVAAERGLDRARAASIMVNLVWVLGVDQGLHDRAHDYGDQAAAVLAGLGGDLVMEADLGSYTASVLRDEGKEDRAVVLLREVLDKRRVAFGLDHPRYAMALNNLAATLGDQGKYAEALEIDLQALAINAKSLGEHHPDYALSLQSTASLLNLLGRPAEGRPRAQEAIAVFQQALGPDHPRVASAEWALALIDEKLGEYAEAEGLLRHAITAAEATQGANNAHVADYVCILGDVLVSEGRPADAVPLYQRALAVYEAIHNDMEASEARSDLGLALLKLARPADALAVLEPALKFQETGAGNARELAHARFRTARALWAAGGDRTRARKLAEQAVETYSSDAAEQRELIEATAWLDSLPTAADARAVSR